MWPFECLLVKEYALLMSLNNSVIKLMGPSHTAWAKTLAFNCFSLTLWRWKLLRKILIWWMQRQSEMRVEMKWKSRIRNSNDELENGVWHMSWTYYLFITLHPMINCAPLGIKSLNESSNPIFSLLAGPDRWPNDRKGLLLRPRSVSR